MKAVVLIVLAVQMVLGAGVRVARAQQQDVCVSTIPPNIQAGLLTQDVIGLLQTSPTFRAQCERIGAARAVHVDLELLQTFMTMRAETTIARYEAGALRAKVRISFGQDYRELIAHEFEHIIEQLDGVDLHTEVERGRAWVVDAHAFETRRAEEVGRRVRRECESANSAAVHWLR